jgi:hypothetical protein
MNCFFISQRTEFFIATAVKISNLTYFKRSMKHVILTDFGGRGVTLFRIEPIKRVFYWYFYIGVLEPA